MSLSDVVSVPPQAGAAKDNDDVTVDDTVGGTVILDANAKRRSALIINTGTNSMRVTTDGSAPTTSHGKLLPGGAALTLSSPYCPTAEVLGFSTAGTTANASEVS